MLGYIYADRYEQLRSRQDSGPWKQTLKAASEFSGRPNGLQSLFDKIYERGDDRTLMRSYGISNLAKVHSLTRSND